jgi:uncharacterized protein YdhG (YjbR/CyaY superfamily)
MKRRTTGFESIDEYIVSFPKPVQKKLRDLRKAIRELAPDAEEKISYQIPTFHLGRNLVHFAAYANHIGFYPTSSGIRSFKSKLSKYKYSKGAIQFPLKEPLPMNLIKNIVRFRVQEESKRK